ncbi:hypothetical protein [Haladaptatus sp. NG-SE-30]
MGVVRRDGKWTLEKERDGVYNICERGDCRAQIITNDYESHGPMDTVQMDVMTHTIEVYVRHEATSDNMIKIAFCMGIIAVGLELRYTK